MDLQEAWGNLLGEEVVVDTATPVVYIGRLSAVNEHFVSLADADVVDTGQGQVTKSVIAIEACRHGITPSRDAVEIKQSAVLSLSRLKDVRLY